MSSQQTVAELIIEGLQMDGAHHKQWYLAEIARRLGIPLVVGLEDVEDLGMPG